MVAARPASISVLPRCLTPGCRLRRYFRAPERACSSPENHGGRPECFDFSAPIPTAPGGGSRQLPAAPGGSRQLQSSRRLLGELILACLLKSPGTQFGTCWGLLALMLDLLRPPGVHFGPSV